MSLHKVCSDFATGAMRSETVLRTKLEVALLSELVELVDWLSEHNMLTESIKGHLRTEIYKRLLWETCFMLSVIWKDISTWQGGAIAIIGFSDTYPILNEQNKLNLSRDPNVKSFNLTNGAFKNAFPVVDALLASEGTLNALQANVEIDPTNDKIQIVGLVLPSGQVNFIGNSTVTSIPNAYKHTCPILVRYEKEYKRAKNVYSKLTAPIGSEAGTCTTCNADTPEVQTELPENSESDFGNPVEGFYELEEDALEENEPKI